MIRVGRTYVTTAKVKNDAATYFKLLDSRNFLVVVDESHHTDDYWNEDPDAIPSDAYLYGKYERKENMIQVMGADEEVDVEFENTSSVQKEMPSKVKVMSTKERRSYFAAKAKFITTRLSGTKVTIRRQYNQGDWTSKIWQLLVKLSMKYFGDTKAFK